MPTTSEVTDLEQIAKRVRYSLVQMHHRAQTGHIGGALSCVDILVALQGRGRIVLSKGHAASALYACAALATDAPKVWPAHLEIFNERWSTMPEQPAPHSFATTWATGSLGHGLSVGLGFALADRLKGNDTRTYVVLSDGECQEGSVWEAAMLAASLKLSNLTAIVDANGWQAIGRTIADNMDLEDKFTAFGWTAETVSGNDPSRIAMKLDRRDETHPYALIAHTKKGAGISFMEDDNNWHYRHPSAEDVARARAELGQ